MLKTGMQILGPTQCCHTAVFPRVSPDNEVCPRTTRSVLTSLCGTDLVTPTPRSVKRDLVVARTQGLIV
jgi:hypothetical protein